MVIKKNLKKKFGSYIRELRIKNEIGQRELADKIGIAASYLNDIEKEKRAAPKYAVIKKLSTLLKVNIENGKTENVIKLDGDKISRPYILNKKMYILRNGAIIKVE